MCVDCIQKRPWLQGGKDAASARYVFTKLSPWTRKLFPEEDDSILSYRMEEGEQIEPLFFVPVIPLVLVNGAEGVGTGWSTNIPTYNPLDIINNVARVLVGERMHDMVPHARGFKGPILPLEQSFVSCGVATQMSSTTVRISELPLGKWTDDFKEQLEHMAREQRTIRHFSEHNTHETVSFEVHMSRSDMQRALDVGLVDYFKLKSAIHLSNMHLFNSQGSIQRYTSPLHIIEEFMPVRLEYYGKRKQFVLQRLERVVERLHNRANFVSLVISGELRISKRTKQELVAELRQRGLASLPAAEHAVEDNSIERGYDYLLSMPLSSLTSEKVAALMHERSSKESELTRLRAKSEQDMWQDDLRALRDALPQ